MFIRFLGIAAAALSLNAGSALADCQTTCGDQCIPSVDDCEELQNECTTTCDDDNNDGNSSTTCGDQCVPSPDNCQELENECTSFAGGQGLHHITGVQATQLFSWMKTQAGK